MKTKIFLPCRCIFKIVFALCFALVALVAVYGSVVMTVKAEWDGLVFWICAFCACGVLVWLLLKPAIIIKGDKVIFYGDFRDNNCKKIILCSDVISYEICKNKDGKMLEPEFYGRYNREFKRVITLYAKMKKQSPLHISLDGFTKKQRQKIVAEIEKRRDYYATIIEKERQEKIKAKLQEQKNRGKQ